jgi:hypothetical protein
MVTRIGTPRSAVEHIDRNLFLVVKGRRKFRGFIQQVGGSFRYVRLYKDENIIRYVEGGAMSVDTTILHLLAEYGIHQIDYHWGGRVYSIVPEDVLTYGIHKPVGFENDQYHVPLGKWHITPSYKRRWIPNVNEEVVQEEEQHATL